MADTKSAKQRAPLRRWALAEKRRVVELTFRDGASVAAIAREQWSKLQQFTLVASALPGWQV